MSQTRAGTALAMGYREIDATKRAALQAMSGLIEAMSDVHDERTRHDRATIEAHT